MFDFGAWEVALIAVVVIFVIGPKELPATLRALGTLMRKLHNLSVIFRAHVDDMVREAELDELRKTAKDIRDGDYGTIVEDTIDPDHSLRDGIDLTAPSPEPDVTQDADQPINRPRDEA